MKQPTEDYDFGDHQKHDALSAFRIAFTITIVVLAVLGLLSVVAPSWVSLHTGPCQ